MLEYYVKNEHVENTDAPLVHSHTLVYDAGISGLLEEYHIKAGSSPDPGITDT